MGVGHGVHASADMGLSNGYVLETGAEGGTPPAAEIVAYGITDQWDTTSWAADPPRAWAHACKV